MTLTLPTYCCSGYPGVIYSGDDFTVASSGLTILETTIGNSNKHLWQYVQVRMAIIFTKIFRNVSRLRGQYWRESGQLWQTGWQLTGTPGRRSSLGTTAGLTTTSGWWSTTTSSTPGRWTLNQVCFGFWNKFLATLEEKIWQVFWRRKHFGPATTPHIFQVHWTF